MTRSPIASRLTPLLLASLLSGCAALPFIIPPLVEFGANLLSTAATNYGESHQQNMQNLLTSLRQTTNPSYTPGIVTDPYGQGGYGQTGYPNQDYPDQQGYGGYQTYPSSPAYGQQPYDPYQGQQPGYGGGTPYPTDPYASQGQPVDPSFGSPIYPGQQASAPGYPVNPQPSYPQQGEAGSGYPGYQNSYPNQPQYPNQPAYPNNQNPYPQQPYIEQGQPYPGTSYPTNPPTQPSYNPYDHAGLSSPSGYPNQPTESLENLIPSETQPVQPAAEPISLDVLLVKKHLVNGVQSYLPIKDGDVLMDGRGNPQAGDKFRVMFRPHQDGYVYVIAVDGSALAQGIFPSASTPFANPVKAGQQYILPEGNNWFSLDQFKGIETIFFVTSPAPRKDIEDILTTITGRERSPLEKPQAVSEPAIVPHGYSGTRPGNSPFAVQTSTQQKHELLPTTYFVQTAGEDLRITRWFRHQ